MYQIHHGKVSPKPYKDSNLSFQTITNEMQKKRYSHVENLKITIPPVEEKAAGRSSELSNNLSPTSKYEKLLSWDIPSFIIFVKDGSNTSHRNTKSIKLEITQYFKKYEQQED